MTVILFCCRKSFNYQNRNLLFEFFWVDRTNYEQSLEHINSLFADKFGKHAPEYLVEVPFWNNDSKLQIKYTERNSAWDVSSSIVPSNITCSHYFPEILQPLRCNFSTGHLVTKRFFGAPSGNDKNFCSIHINESFLYNSTLITEGYAISCGVHFSFTSLLFDMLQSLTLGNNIHCSPYWYKRVQLQDAMKFFLRALQAPIESRKSLIFRMDIELVRLILIIQFKAINVI